MEGNISILPDQPLIIKPSSPRTCPVRKMGEDWSSSVCGLLSSPITALLQAEARQSPVLSSLLGSNKNTTTVTVHHKTTTTTSTIPGDLKKSCDIELVELDFGRLTKVKSRRRTKRAATQAPRPTSSTTTDSSCDSSSLNAADCPFAPSHREQSQNIWRHHWE